MKQKPGRKPLSLTVRQSLVHKLEPYLKAGLSIRTACLESGVPRSTLYKLMDEDPAILDQINRFQNYLNVITVTALARHLFSIGKRQQQGYTLVENEVRFLQWFATHSRLCKEEFGKEPKQIPGLDAQAEIMRLTKIIDAHCENQVTMQGI